MQKAVFVTEVGKPLQLGERAIPTPGPGFVQVKVKSSMILPHDSYGLYKGLFIGQHLPFILGTNIVGIVSSVGPDVTKYSVGDSVVGYGDPTSAVPDFSGLQEYALLNVENSTKVPHGLSLDDIAAFPVNSITSFIAVFDDKGFGFPTSFDHPSPALSKETILVVGGGSNVGKMAIQFAALIGVGKILTIASAGRTEELKKLGVTHVIDRHGTPEAIAKEIKEITAADGGLTKIYDCVSWDYSFDLELLAESKNHGHLLTLHPVDQAQELVKEKGLDVTVTFIFGNPGFMKPSLNKQFWESLPGWVQDGKLGIPKYRFVEGFDLEKIGEGLKSYLDGSAVTPVIVHP